MTTLTKQLRGIRDQIGAPCLRTKRSIGWAQVRDALALAKDAKRRARVYSPAGFVPHSYGYRCQIQFVEITKTHDGRLVIDVGWTGAARSHGRGNLMVVQ